MASSFSRTGSTSNRRSANVNGTRSRLSTSRTGEYVEPILQPEDMSPKDQENPVNERSSKRFSKDLKTTERRVEKKTVLTREKIIRRSPVKESTSAGNRGDVERQTKHVESPTSRRPQKEPEERERTSFVEGKVC